MTDELPEKLKFTNDTISKGQILRRITGYEIDSIDARETAIAERVKEHKKNLENGIISFIDLNKLIEELTREK